MPGSMIDNYKNGTEEDLRFTKSNIVLYALIIKNEIKTKIMEQLGTYAKNIQEIARKKFMRWRQV